MICQAKKQDIPAAAGLAAQLFSCAAEELEGEFAELIPSEDCAVFLSVAEDGPVGFAQCQLRRDYVEGTRSSPVGYLEGIFVLPAYRNQGRARALLAAWREGLHGVRQRLRAGQQRQSGVSSEDGLRGGKPDHLLP